VVGKCNILKGKCWTGVHLERLVMFIVFPLLKCRNLMYGYAASRYGFQEHYFALFEHHRIYTYAYMKEALCAPKYALVVLPGIDLRRACSPVIITTFNWMAACMTKKVAAGVEAMHCTPH